MMELQDKFAGSLLGSALGDAVGQLAFTHSSGSALQEALQHRGTLCYTDDTAMAVALAESLCAQAGVNAQHIGASFQRHYEREPWRGYGAGPPAVFAMVQQQQLEYREAAQRLYGEGSLGNGAAMRIAPLALLCHDAPNFYDLARLSAEVTHAHPLGIDGAAVQAKAIAQALVLDPADGFSRDAFVADLIAWAKTQALVDKLQRLAFLLDHAAAPQAAAAELGCGVSVHESMPYALFCFLRHAQCFEDCLYCAVLHGGDRDTMGAMAGAISGAYLGIDAPPKEWRRRLENREHIEELARQLFRLRRQLDSA